MTESAPLLDNVDENAPRVVETHTNLDTEITSASAYFRPLFKRLATTTVVISVVTIVLLVTTDTIIGKTPVENPYTWHARDTIKALTLLMSGPLVISGISTLINFPILLNVVVDVVLLAYIIPRVADLIGAVPDSWWCRSMRYPPGSPPELKCLHWKSIITILMGMGAGFALLICIIYAVQLLLRGIAIHRTKLWKRPLSWTLPALPREISIHFSIRVLRQGEAGTEGSGHGPVHL